MKIPIQKLKRRYKYQRLQPQPCHYKSSPAKDDPKDLSVFSSYVCPFLLKQWPHILSGGKYAASPKEAKPRIIISYIFFSGKYTKLPPFWPLLLIDLFHVHIFWKDQA